MALPLASRDTPPPEAAVVVVVVVQASQEDLVEVVLEATLQTDATVALALQALATQVAQRLLLRLPVAVEQGP